MASLVTTITMTRGQAVELMGTLRRAYDLAFEKADGPSLSEELDACWSFLANKGGTPGVLKSDYVSLSHADEFRRIAMKKNRTKAPALDREALSEAVQSMNRTVALLENAVPLMQKLALAFEVYLSGLRKRTERLKASTEDES